MSHAEQVTKKGRGPRSVTDCSKEVNASNVVLLRLSLDLAGERKTYAQEHFFFQNRHD